MFILFSDSNRKSFSALIDLFGDEFDGHFVD